MLDAVNYKNGQKNNWRRTMWNHIEDLVDDKRRGAILYLPGDTDLDRPEALRRGFQDADLIAVERNPAVVARLRTRGVITICGTLNDVLQGWPDSDPLTAVIADYQAGANDDTFALTSLLAMKVALDGAVVAVNFQRGRDLGAQWREHMSRKGWFNALRYLLSAHDCPSYPELMARYVAMASNQSSGWRCPLEKEIGHFETTKNRVAVFGAAVADALLVGVHGDLRRRATAEAIAARSNALVKERALQLRALPSYRSTEKSPLMDGAVVRVRLGDHRIDQFVHPVLPMVNAARAIRTRRLRGELSTARARHKAFT